MKVNHLWNKFWTWALSVSVRVKIMGIAIFLITLLGGGVILQIRVTLISTLQEQLEQRGVSIARDVVARSEKLILINDLYELYKLLKDTLENNKDVRYVFILDSSKNLLVHTLGGIFPSNLIQANSLDAGTMFHLEVFDSNEGLIRDIAMPIFEGQGGIVRVGMSEKRLRAMVASTTRRILAIIGITYLISVIAAYFLTLILTKPIFELVRVTRAVGGGDFQQKAPVWADDEISQLCAAFNSMTENLEEYRQKLQKKEQMRAHLLEKVIAAQEEERKRIARELHDGMGQHLTSLMFGLKALESVSTDDEVHRRSKELGSLAADILQEMQNLSVEIRPSALDDLGLVVVLAKYTRDFAKKFGVKMDYHVVGLEGKRLLPEVETTLYRITQEALTNIAKHAEAKSVNVLLESRGSSVLAIIEDDGKGFDVEQVLESDEIKRKLGLFGMQERAYLVGGTLTIESTPKMGTTVFAEVPINGKMEGS